MVSCRKPVCMINRHLTRFCKQNIATCKKCRTEIVNTIVPRRPTNFRGFRCFQRTIRIYEFLLTALSHIHVRRSAANNNLKRGILGIPTYHKNIPTCRAVSSTSMTKIPPIGAITAATCLKAGSWETFRKEFFVLKPLFREGPEWRRATPWDLFVFAKHLLLILYFYVVTVLLNSHRLALSS